ncbi:hypothetical protein PBI_DONOVAN_52 [Mycobacterium phage Donovan]|uniref:Uncharacterized protein n=1 Tax=Mycobacterium phage Donovan TaxID=1429793 RepID=W0LJ01_9CAUD|nr:hypothetical protein PBI_DONOVAN_52 [Mycobacterium phage Donovan]AHG23756.1 hypothetical protein PBI_DONOVAN_52 [Mycobacterium phage Donovan]WRQ08417.1 hypothetical protein JDBV10_00040 [Mycobacterium phage juyeon]
MTAIDYDNLDVVRPLIGDGVPSKSTLPAVWWLTTDPRQVDAFDTWLADYKAHVEKVGELAKSLGLDGAEDAYMWSGGTSSVITGFRVPTFMGHWNTEHPDYRPIPSGWRIDKKENLLVPSRKTKADRESQANKDFGAIKRVPNVRAYMSGLPTEIALDDRSFGGTIYAVNYRRGENCVWAYSGGDPDRQPEKRANAEIDTSVWHRMKLSILAALMEEKAERAKAEEVGA